MAERGRFLSGVHGLMFRLHLKLGRYTSHVYVLNYVYHANTLCYALLCNCGGNEIMKYDVQFSPHSSGNRPGPAGVGRLQEIFSYKY